MSPSLHRIILLKTTRTRCVFHCNQKDTYKNILLGNQTNIASPHARFLPERVDSGENLYNIRCYYNNRYWSCDDSGLVQATEKNTGDATLFRVEHLNNNDIRLMHTKLKRYVCITGHDWVLKAESETRRTDSYDVFTVIDWGSLVLLPGCAAFKWIKNGCYLSIDIMPDGRSRLSPSTKDIGDRFVATDIKITPFNYRIFMKNHYKGWYWNIKPSYEYKQGVDVPAWDDTDSELRATNFSPEKTGDDGNVIALRNVRYDTYCRIEDGLLVTSEDKDATMRDDFKFQVQELVLSRKVFDVDFQFDNSFIYNSGPIESIVNETTNWLPYPTKDKQLKLECKGTTSNTYDTRSSIRSSKSFSLEATVPVIKDKVSFTPRYMHSTETGREYAWGEATARSFRITVFVTIAVPAKTKLKAEMQATKSTCDIPFSYTQQDITTEGKLVVECKDDGVYTCTNYYDFNIRITQEKL